MKYQGTFNDANNFVQTSRPTVIDEVDGYMVEGSLDNSNNFVYPTKAYAYETDGDMRIVGTYTSDRSGNTALNTFEIPTRTIAYELNDDMYIQGTLIEGNFTYSPRAEAILIDGDYEIYGNLDSEGNFVMPKSPLVFKED